MRVYGAAGAGGGLAAGQPAGKRRWKGQAVTVLALVVFSLLVPLAFLLGLHTRFPGYVVDDRSLQEISFVNYGNVASHEEQSPSKDDQPGIPNLKDDQPGIPKLKVDQLGIPDPKDNQPDIPHLKDDQPGIPNLKDDQPGIPKLQDDQRSIPNLTKEYSAATLPKNADSVFPAEEPDKGTNNTIRSPTTVQKKESTTSEPPPKDVPKSKDPAAGNNGASEETSSPRTTTGAEVGKSKHDKGLNAFETENSCELEFGSYCLWSRKHRVVMKDSIVKRLKDQLFVARSYYPSIAKLQGQESLTRELKLNIQDHERMLSEAVSDPDLPVFVEKKIKKMDEIVARAKSYPVDCTNVERKLRQILDLTGDEAHFHMKQSAFLYQLGVQTMSKSFHCLSMRLTVEFFKSRSADPELSSIHKIDNPGFQHYVIFSRNILALSVTINSTVVNSEDSDSMVFHVLTDKQNFYSMKHWFARNACRNATIHILNFDELKFILNANMNLADLSMSEEFRVSTHSIAQPSSLQMGTKYLSVFGHSHFLLSDIFKNIKKVIVLDDDVVIQKDISFLWNLDLGGKVNGAIQFCGVKLGQLKSYLGTSGYDGNSCAWMSGLNVIDLEKWREYDITGIYQKFLQKLQRGNEAQWKAATLPASLLAFHDQIYPLDDALFRQGLGHEYGVSEDILSNAAALHYNGNMKPWLDLGIPRYKKYWKKYLTRDERFMDECNVNP